MSKTNNCIKCGGEMRKGDICFDVTSPQGGLGRVNSMMVPYQSIRLPIETGTHTEVLRWREYTGREKGWLIKQKEQKTLTISGERCINCGYVELFVKEK
jgi:hypothetical protein